MIPELTEESFIGAVTTFAEWIGEKTQQEWTITLPPKGYTHDQRMADLRDAGALDDNAIERAIWHGRREREARVPIPPWLIPGTEEWNKQVNRCGFSEMKERRQIALEQQKQAKSKLNNTSLKVR